MPTLAKSSREIGTGKSRDTCSQSSADFFLAEWRLSSSTQTAITEETEYSEIQLQGSFKANTILCVLCNPDVAAFSHPSTRHLLRVAADEVGEHVLQLIGGCEHSTSAQGLMCHTSSAA